LSIKQTEEAPARQQRPPQQQFKGPAQNFKKREPEEALPMNDALAMLKKKFGK
jgi:uncharacterized protein